MGVQDQLFCNNELARLLDEFDAVKSFNQLGSDETVEDYN